MLCFDLSSSLVLLGLFTLFVLSYPQISLLSVLPFTPIPETFQDYNLASSNAGAR